MIERPGQDRLFIEIKSTDQIHSLSDEKLNGFKALVKDSKKTKGIVISQDPMARAADGIYILPWQEAFQKIFFDNSF